MAYIEVEQKFVLSQESDARIKSLCNRVGEVRHIQDVYYDTKDFTFVKSNRYLRLRNGTYEAKLVAKGYTAAHPIYDEVTDSLILIETFGINEMFLDYIKNGIALPPESGFTPFIDVTCDRYSFEYEIADTGHPWTGIITKLTFDLDYSKNGDMIAECEVVVQDESLTSFAHQCISYYTQEVFKLTPSRCGKGRMYIHRKYPELELEMISSGIYEPL